LEALLNAENHHSAVFGKLKHLIALRRKQAAFHPNATQFTLHLGDTICAFWRQSLNRDQSIFALNNVTAQEQKIVLKDINLIEMDNWVDLITNIELRQGQKTLTLRPYQSVWLSN